jgi:hypothetical protein
MATEVSSDPDWMPFEPDEYEPMLLIIDGKTYKVIGESESGWLLAIPFALRLVSKLAGPSQAPEV